MLKTVVVGATLALFMMSLSTLAFNAHLAKAQGNLLLAIEVDKTMMTVGECVNITLTLQNVGTDNVTLIYGPPVV